MTDLTINTEIKAPIQVVFDGARSIDIHELSTAKTNEKAIAGRTSGLCELGDEVTWRARHFGVYQNLSSRITKFKAPFYFQDCMIEGAFSFFRMIIISKKKWSYDNEGYFQLWRTLLDFWKNI